MLLKLRGRSVVRASRGKQRKTEGNIGKQRQREASRCKQRRAEGNREAFRVGFEVRTGVGAQDCDIAAFSAGAAQVTRDCCGASAAGTGHRRRLAESSGCAIPSVCPSRECSSTFSAFFDRCRARLAELPTMAQYEVLYEDCTGRDGAAAALDGVAGSCADDPDGILASYGISCAVLLTTGPCSEDLGIAGWPVPRGTAMQELCPIACAVPGCAGSAAAGGEEAGGCRLEAGQPHATAGDTVTARALGCGAGQYACRSRFRI